MKRVRCPACKDEPHQRGKQEEHAQTGSHDHPREIQRSVEEAFCGKREKGHHADGHQQMSCQSPGIADARQAPAVGVLTVAKAEDHREQQNQRGTYLGRAVGPILHGPVAREREQHEQGRGGRDSVEEGEEAAWAAVAIDSRRQPHRGIPAVLQRWFARYLRLSRGLEYSPELCLRSPHCALRGICYPCCTSCPPFLRRSPSFA